MQKVHWGSGDAKEFIESFLQNTTGRDGGKVLLVTGRASWKKSGAEDFFERILGERFVVRRFGDFSENPKIEELESALKFFQADPCAKIIAVGGGTAIDMAKLIGFFISSRMDCREYLAGKRRSIETAIPILAVPTTAGSGSESTHFAVLYVDGVKNSIEEERIRPDYVLLNPSFTHTLSPYITACTGFDAFAQAMESFWAVGSTPESRHDSLMAMKLCLQNLEMVVSRPTTESRAAMLKASHLAGRAIDVAKTTAAHAFSYTLTAEYGLPHGHAVATFLPEILRQNGTAEKSRVIDSRGPEHLARIMAEILNILGCKNVDDAVQFLYLLRSKIGLTDDWMKKEGTSFDELFKKSIKSANMARLNNNPVLIK